MLVGVLGSILAAVHAQRAADEKWVRYLETFSSLVATELSSEPVLTPESIARKRSWVAGLIEGPGEIDRVTVLKPVRSGFEVLIQYPPVRERTVWTVSQVVAAKRGQGWTSVKGDDGRDRAVVIVGRTPEPGLDLLAPHWTVTGLTCLLLVGLGLSRQASRWRARVVIAPTVRKTVRRHVLEGLLVVSLGVLCVDGALVAIKGASLEGERLRAQHQMNVLTMAIDVCHQVANVPPGFLPRARAAVANLRRAGYAEPARQMEALFEKPASAWRDGVVDVRSMLFSRRELTERRVEEAQRDQSAILMRSSQAVIVAVLLTVGCLVILRLTSRHDERLAAAVDGQYRAQSDYEALLDTVPLDVLGYANGRGLFANEGWAATILTSDTEDPLTAFYRAVAPEDRATLRATLETSEADRTAASCPVRLTTLSGETLLADVRIAPTFGPDGHFRHMLVFLVDTTAIHAAEQQLQTRNMEIEIKNAQLSRTLDELEESLESVVRTMVRAIEAKDIYTAGHSERVMKYSLWIGEELGLGPYEMRILEVGALIHDLGKIGIPDEVLMKPSKLNDDEFALIKSHPIRGVEIMERISQFQDCLPIVLWHHEKLDGSGYPDGLEGDQIPLLVRIVTVADIFDAMTSSRAYRGAIRVPAVLLQIHQEAAAGKLDPMCAEALHQALIRRGLDDSLDAGRPNQARAA